MRTSELTLHSTLSLRDDRSLRNRIVVPPMASQTASVDGSTTEKTVAHYRRLAEAQPGLLIVEYSFVHTSGRSEEHQLSAVGPEHLMGHRQIAAAIRSSGALAGLQLSHGGGKSSQALTGGQLMGPSGIRVPVKDDELEIPRPMMTDDIIIWKTAFRQAADLAVAAGYDLIELHSAHGYGLNQWISPLTNQRSDGYGGSLQGRSRLLLEIVEEIRSAYPHLLLSVRIPGQDFLEGGLQVGDSVKIAQALEARGVDILHVSSGIGGWRRPSTRLGEGYLVMEAAEIQSHVRIPVIGVGGIETAAYIDNGLKQGWFSLATVGRAILKDPGAWYRSQVVSRTTA